MKVSVIMSCFNSESTIRTSVESILKQSYEDFEFLICDDGSIDNTYNTLLELSQNDKRIRVLKNDKNIGLTKSLNRLIDESSMPLIARQDDDDISFPNRFAEQIKFLKDENYDLCVSRAFIKNSQRLIPSFSFLLPSSFVINFKNPFIHGTLMIKKNVLMDIGKYDERFYYAQDYKLFSDLLSSGAKYKKLKTPLYELNTKDNISSKYTEKQEYYARCVRTNKIPNKRF